MPDDLKKLKRDELDKEAIKAGVPDPDELPNKDAVIEAIEAPNPALAPVPDADKGEVQWTVVGPNRVHGTAPGGTFAAAESPQIALLVESGHIERSNVEG